MQTTQTGKWLFPYAYNILGTVDDAKDIVQQVLLTMLGKGISNFEPTGNEHKNYLIKSVINAAVTLKEKQQRIVAEDTPWLPEPVATNTLPGDELEMRDVLNYSLLVLMEKLNAKERAVFILSESFDYAHSEIAEVLGISTENSRKLLSRAKQALFKPSQEKPISTTQRDKEILQQLIEAIRGRDTDKLQQLVASDILYYGDGGGKIPMAATYMAGAENVIALQILAYHKYLAKARMEYVTINHQPALVTFVGKYLTGCQVFDLHPVTGKVMQISVLLDPLKLKSLSKSITKTE